MDIFGLDTTHLDRIFWRIQSDPNLSISVDYPKYPYPIGTLVPPGWLKFSASTVHILTLPSTLPILAQTRAYQIITFPSINMVF